MRAIYVVALVTILEGFFLPTSLATTHRLAKRDVGNDLFVSCDKGFSMGQCQKPFDDAWKDGKLQQFTTEHQFATYDVCKFTWWTDDTNGFTKSTQEDWGSVFSRIDKFCASTSQSGNTNRAVWVGSIDNSYLVFQVEVLDISNQRL
ncbi:hypothetical protein O181_012833 [Austropuccinia psidii MF-1]|uniref:Ecp2 effector protein domain-containing protein n=1 Tax=Austropuccinia psidii MF-1 TaxID=1389203 RepID=A0A9Q3BXI3_9BASI|nr:hypothetical protein [Austropuccinia psidii MF-1]